MAAHVCRRGFRRGLMLALGWVGLALSLLVLLSALQRHDPFRLRVGVPLLISASAALALVVRRPRGSGPPPWRRSPARRWRSRWQYPPRHPARLSMPASAPQAPAAPLPDLPLVVQVAALAEAVQTLPTRSIPIQQTGRFLHLRCDATLQAQLTLLARQVIRQRQQLALVDVQAAPPTVAPCLPLLRHGRALTWWSLAYAPQLLLVGDAAPTALLAALLWHALPLPATPLLWDPGHVLASLDPAAPAHQADALAVATEAVRQAAWHTAQGRPVPTPSQTLLAVVSDGAGWVAVLPLLRAPHPALSLMVAALAPPPAAARDLGHRLPVVWVGGGTAPLPDAFVPAGIATPRRGQAVCWGHGAGPPWTGRAVGWDAALLATLVRSAAYVP